MFGEYHGAINNTDIYLVVSEAEASELIHRAAAVQGGVFIPNPVWNRLTGNVVITGHPPGGCVMSGDVATRVDNHKGEVYCAESGKAVHHPGLLVTNGVVVSRWLGVNSLLTITALAVRSCAYFARQRCWMISYEPMRPTSTNAAQA